MWIVLVAVFALCAPALADCPATSASVDAEIVRAETAFGALDLATFRIAHDALHTDLGCLSERVGGPLAARVHGMDALSAFVAKDDPAATASLRAARAADPAFTLPAVVPEGHRLRTMYAETPQAPGPQAPLEVPVGTRALVDGQTSATRPTDRPFVMVLEDDGGNVLWSSLVATASPVPDLGRYAVAPAPVPVAKPRKTIRPALAVSGALTAVGSGVLLGLASASAAKFADEATTYEELNALRTRANTFTLLGSAGVGVTIGLGTATALSLREVE